MIASAQTIRSLCSLGKQAMSTSLISPYVERTVDKASGKSYGLSSAGYDIRVDKFTVDGQIRSDLRMSNGDFILASSLERIVMPKNMIAIVHDKSSWAREGLALQNTVLEPGWEGYITLELSFHRPKHHITIKSGDPIAQLIFHYLDQETDQPYVGKYQNQPNEPIEAIKEQKEYDDEYR